LLTRRPLHAVDRVLIQARSEALLSIFRIDSVRSGESLEVEDVLDGERHTLFDPDLATEAFEGWVLPLRLARVQRWTFPLLAGPQVPSTRLEGMLERLKSYGLELTHEGLRSGAHLLGRLWSWYLEEQMASTQEPRSEDADSLE